MATMMLSKNATMLSKGTRSAMPARARTVSVRAVANNRPMWYPGAKAPAHLDGSMLGDYGFDPLRLGVNKDNLKWFREAELTNARWAMAAVAGILFTDLVGLPKFWLAGAESYPVDIRTQLVIGTVLFAVLEGKRYEGWKKTGESGFLNFFPFDPLNLRSEQMRLKEIKNGRLAMVALVGFFSQAGVRGLGPIDSLKLHLEDPTHNNIFTSSVGPESVLTVIVLSLWPILIEASKSLAPKDAKENIPFFPWTEPWFTQNDGYGQPKRDVPQ